MTRKALRLIFVPTIRILIGIPSHTQSKNIMIFCNALPATTQRKLVGNYFFDSLAFLRKIVGCPMFSRRKHDGR